VAARRGGVGAGGGDARRLHGPGGGEVPSRQAAPFLRRSILPPILIPVKLLLENLPASLIPQRETLRRCLEAMDAALPIQQIILFGSHARGDARPDSDIDLCLVAEGATRQFDAARQWRTAMSPLRPFLAFSLIPITPQRLAEKRARGDFFFQTVIEEGVALAAQD